MIVIGKVRKIKIGFTMAFKKASTNAKIIATPILSICTPDNILDKT
jgi:hypothetical protein